MGRRVTCPFPCEIRWLRTQGTRIPILTPATRRLPTPTPDTERQLDMPGRMRTPGTQPHPAPETHMPAISRRGRARTRTPGTRRHPAPETRTPAINRRGRARTRTRPMPGMHLRHRMREWRGWPGWPSW
jgi:hypothetical protein